MKILLHICCAPCSTAVIDRLNEEGHEVTGFFYNPNIQPKEEYDLRKKEVQNYSVLKGFELLIGDYNYQDWDDITADYKNDPEGGKRCSICYKMRLLKTAVTAKKGGFESFTTTLSISPHKDVNKINELGKRIGKENDVAFLEADFKKKNGFHKSVCMSRDLGLYRQDYCGCIYSKIERKDSVNKKHD